MIEKRVQPTVDARSNTPNTGNRRQQLMERRKQLVMNAMAAALKVRRAAGITLWAPVCVYDLADQLEVEVRFVDIPSMEGMYYKNNLPAIFVSSLRPAGRQAFNCAHELGHHIFKHGSRIDKMTEFVR